jgi:hypothetical protein
LRHRVFQGNSYEPIAARGTRVGDTLAAGAAAAAGTQVTAMCRRFHLSVLGCATPASAISKTGTAATTTADFMPDPVTGEVSTAFSGFSGVGECHQLAAILTAGAATHATAMTPVERPAHSLSAAAVGLRLVLAGIASGRGDHVAP